MNDNWVYLDSYYFLRFSPCPLTLSVALSASSLGGHRQNQLGIESVSVIFCYRINAK